MDEDTRKALRLLTDSAVTWALFLDSLVRQAPAVAAQARALVGGSDPQEALGRRLAELRTLQQELATQDGTGAHER
jgi:hypothetical protein